MKIKLLSLALILLATGLAFDVAAQTDSSEIRTGLLLSRHRDDASGRDNYEYATYSFLIGNNGPEAQKLIRNNWDVQFRSNISDGKRTDYFDVTMVVDDRSRIVDLGSLTWSDAIELPELPAFEKPAREKAVEAKLGHIYYVHTADRNSDHYALFRVEEMQSGESVRISWKLIGQPTEGSK